MEGINIERLKSKFRQLILHSKQSYQDIYCLMSLGVKSSFDYALKFDEDPTYYCDGVGYRLSLSDYKNYDLPTIKIIIPLVKFLAFTKNIAFCDYCLRDFVTYIDMLNEENHNRNKDVKTNGAYYIDHPESIVRLRNSCYIEKESLIILMQVQLPVKDFKKGMRMVTKILPSTVGLYLERFNYRALNASLELFANQEIIRKYLKDHNYVAFIGSGSLLARNLDNDKPLPNCKPFASCPEDEIIIPLINGSIRGLGIKSGITVLLGGAYAGKSTILNAIFSGVYNHKNNDGREYVITNDDAIKIKAEDGRCINNVDLSMFINSKSNNNHFSCSYASGATSQAANIVEAINMGSKLLILDEDSTATNFMICDEQIKSLVKDMGITPFNERIRELYNDLYVSSILVVGSCARYLETADCIYIIEKFTLKKFKAQSFERQKSNINWINNRFLKKKNNTLFTKEIVNEYIEVIHKDLIRIDGTYLNVAQIGQYMTHNQINGLAYILGSMKNLNFDYIELNELYEEIYKKIRVEGLDSLYSYSSNTKRFFEMPRKYEIIMALNRIKGLEILIK